MSTAPDDPCPCGSGFKYADCHQSINESPPAQMLAIAFRQYADRWTVNADAYEAQGIYKKLTTHLSYHAEPSRLLDIGCGQGQGLAALINHFGQTNIDIIGIDENPDCLALAAKRLNVPIPTVRLSPIIKGDRNYDIRIAAGSIKASPTVTLVNTDISRSDRFFEELIEHGSKLDAVTLWFSGTHGAKSFDVDVQALNITSSTGIRIATEWAAADVARHFVRPGGVLHIANRAADLNEVSCRAKIEPQMESLARKSGIRLRSLTLYKYEEPASSDRIAVGQPNVDLFGAKMFVISAIFEI